MRKKKLIARISELESEFYILKLKNDYWKDMIERFTKGLHENGVEVEIVFPEPPTVEFVGDDGIMYHIPGRRDSGGIVELRFDFTEHDAKVKINEDRICSAEKR